MRYADNVILWTPSPSLPVFLASDFGSEAMQQCEEWGIPLTELASGEGPPGEDPDERWVSFVQSRFSPDARLVLPKPRHRR